MPDYDAIIVGAGPNGLAAAITLARASLSVLVIEGTDKIGGGSRTEELTLPGFQHDVCAAVHPLGAASPFFRSLPLAEHGLEWIFPPASIAHPFDDGTAVLLEDSIEATSKNLGTDGQAYAGLMAPLVRDWEEILDDLLAPLPLPPKHPMALLQMGINPLRSARGLAESYFNGARARSFFAGLSAHTMLPLEKTASAASGLILGMLGHANGWPLARGGSRRIIDALADHLHSLGGEIITGWPVQRIDELPPATAIFFNVTPRQLLRIAGDRLPIRYRRQLERFRYGPGAFKMDFALSDPIPWKAKECFQSATVHVGGTLEEISASEKAIWRGEHAQMPFVLLTQQSLFDPSRAPEGKHTAWAYCHVPHGSTFDMSERIETQIERFAPGFRDCILAKRTHNTAQLEAYNPNFVGGDFVGGVQDLWQQFTRPTIKRVPYSTPAKGIYICSSSTPPGGGVHGMCGYRAALAAMIECFIQ